MAFPHLGGCIIATHAAPSARLPCYPRSCCFCRSGSMSGSATMTNKIAIVHLTRLDRIAKEKDFGLLPARLTFFAKTRAIGTFRRVETYLQLPN